MSNFLQAAQTAWQEARRNLRLSLFTILLLVIAFFFADAIFFVSKVTASSVHALREQFQMTVYFNADVRPEEVQSAETELATVAGIRMIENISSVEARQQFEDRHKDDRELIDALHLFDDNPLGARLVLTLKEPGAFSDVRVAIQESTFAAHLRDTHFADVEALLTQVSEVTEKVERAGNVGLIIFSLFALLAMYSVVAIRIASTRDALTIMHMVGATHRFIRFPFLLMTIGYVAVALALNALLLGLLGAWIGESIQLFFTGLPVNPADSFRASLPMFVLAEGVIAAALLSTSTLLAIRRTMYEE